MAPGGGIEPPTNRLTGGRSASELPRSYFCAETRNRTSDKSSSGSRLTTKLLQFLNGDPSGIRTRDLLRDREAL